MPYQSIHHIHRDANHTTRPIEEVLNLMQDHSNYHKNEVSFTSIVLVKTEWTSKHHDIKTWHIIFWSNHRYTDDELAPMLNTDIEDDED